MTINKIISKSIQDQDLNNSNSSDTTLTTNQGVGIVDNLNSLKSSERGPTLLEDFIMREKITHFDHERIPERVVHARGEAAHGYFELYESMSKYTKAGFLNNTAIKTPVFVRFSTVAGSRGSADTARDARGFAVKFYTEEGIYDLVGNNIPVFFIQDAIKFPDLIHAVKPEPNNEIPQASSAHDTFWDFISLTPESIHMIFWLMSDRAIPRSLRMMEGFGVHTFRLVNDAGQSHFVKFHWKPKLGIHSLVWAEAQKIMGKDPDFHRRDLWEAIEAGFYPEWELGLQIVAEEDQYKFPFDLLDPTKLIPEELVPVQIVGKMTLNRNPDNFFAETEQVAFHPGHIVPGIDFSNDPLLQGRLFSYLDTQISRLGGANFHEIPINKPRCPFHNHQRDGMHRQSINTGRVSYHPNSLNNNNPREADIKHGFTSYPDKTSGEKVRLRSESFNDHFSQARLFWDSQSEIEKKHIIEAFEFELGKVENIPVRQRMVELLAHVNLELANQVAKNLTLEISSISECMPKYEFASASLSMNNQKSGLLESRTIAILVAETFNEFNSITNLIKELTNKGAIVKIIGAHSGHIKSPENKDILKIDHSIKTTASVLYDAVLVPNGAQLNQSIAMAEFKLFVQEAYKYFKTIALIGDDAINLLPYSNPNQPGIIINKNSEAILTDFIAEIIKHRHWGRSNTENISV